VFTLDIDIESLTTKIYNQVIAEQEPLIEKELFEEFTRLSDGNGNIDVEAKLASFCLVYTRNSIIASTRILVSLLQEVFPDKFPKHS
jgi:hypothetical protein